MGIKTASDECRVVYYLRKFPVLSETFIRREIRALRDNGLHIHVVADEQDLSTEPEFKTACLADSIRYIGAANRFRLLCSIGFFLVTRPLRLQKVIRSIHLSQYSRFKSLREDVRLFYLVVLLASRTRNLSAKHIHAPWAGVNAFIAMLAAKLCGAEYTAQIRAFELYSPLDRFLLKEKIAGAAFVVTNTQYNVRTIRELAGTLCKTPIYQIYNGIDMCEFQPAPKQIYSSPVERTYRILCVGRLVEQKGIEYLLAACQGLKSEGLRFECEIVGGPFLSRYEAYYRDLLRLHQELELQDCVFFRGAKSFSQVMEYYRRADVFVLPCVIEKTGNRDVIPNVVLEAMAMALPVITTPVAGIPEMIAHGVDGLLIKQRDAVELKSQILRLAADPTLAARLGRAARSRACIQFNIQNNIKKYVALYRSLGTQDLPPSIPDQDACNSVPA